MLTLADLRRRIRSRLDDVEQPYLWCNAELEDALNDAIRDAAIRANLVVQDDFEIAFEQRLDGSWKDKYPLPSGTLYVNSVRLASKPGVVLKQSSYRRIEQYTSSRSTAHGSPLSYVLDQTQPGVEDGPDMGIMVRSIKFIPTPCGENTALLDVVRLPRMLREEADVPELDEIWHQYLVHGALGQMYMKRDTDTFDPERSAKEYALFEEIFGPRLPAVVVRERQTDVPREMIVG